MMDSLSTREFCEIASPGMEFEVDRSGDGLPGFELRGFKKVTFAGFGKCSCNLNRRGICSGTAKFMERPGMSYCLSWTNIDKTKNGVRVGQATYLRVAPMAIVLDEELFEI